MNQVVNYKNRVASRFLPLTKDMIPLRVAEADEYWVSMKLDGHYAGLYVRDGKANFYNRSGKELKLPALEAEAVKLLPKGEYLFAGELYVHDDSKRMRSFHVSEAVSNPDKFDLRFTAFDFIIINNEPILNVEESDAKLTELLGKGTKITPIKYTKVESRSGITELFEKWVEKEGNEGLVVRTTEGATYKVKTRHTFDAVVVAFSEGSGDTAGMIRNVLVGMKYPDGTIQIVGKVGTGFKDELRVELLGKFRKMLSESEYIEIAEKQTAFEFVKPELVIECSCIDLLPEESGMQLMKMSLNYDEAKGYTIVEQRPCINFISPVFVGIRKDKNPDIQDVRFAQITDLIELEDANQKAMAKGSPSQILKREVYIKQAKGETMVRKFICWKTNKEETGKFMPYVFAYTDYSPNRADQLQQELSVAGSESEIMDIYSEYIAENVKKGWELA